MKNKKAQTRQTQTKAEQMIIFKQKIDFYYTQNDAKTVGELFLLVNTLYFLTGLNKWLNKIYMYRQQLIQTAIQVIWHSNNSLK